MTVDADMTCGSLARRLRKTMKGWKRGWGRGHAVIHMYSACKKYSPPWTFSPFIAFTN